MQAGSVLGGKYRLDSVLGQGGMGAVWRGEHLSLKAPVAIKLMEATLAQSADGLARFHREAHAAASIRSPNVVQILDHGVDEATNTPFIVMELLDGETLGKRLSRMKRLSIAATATIVDEVCRALTRAHQAGIVHRDLKPENIFIVKDDHEFAKVLDFGVAKANAYALGAGEGTRTGALIGTPFYMSPEQIRGAKEVDARSDLWSLAVIACECVTGRRPFDEPTVGGLAIAICAEPVPLARSLGPATPAFELWLERALARDPARRFQTAREMSDALRAASEARDPVAEADGAPRSATHGSAANSAHSSRVGPAAPLTQLESVPSLPGRAKALTTASPLSHTFTEPTPSVPKKPAPVSLIAAACGALALVGAGAWFLRGGDESPSDSSAAGQDPGAVELAPPERESEPPRVAPVLPARGDQSTSEGSGAQRDTPGADEGAERPRVQVVKQPSSGEGGEKAAEPPPAKPPAPSGNRPRPAAPAVSKPAAQRPAAPTPPAAPPKPEEPPAPAPAPTPAKSPTRTPNLIDALSGER